MKTIAIGIAGLIAQIGGALIDGASIDRALAADMATKNSEMPLKAPPAPTPAYDWSGFYLGGYYGASWSHSNASTPVQVGNAATGSVDLNSSSSTAGITVGYNLQLSPVWLVGIEGDFGYLGGGQLFGEWDDFIETGEKNRWYATLRGRVGYVTGPSLLYVTGGVGFVHVTDTFGGFFDPPTPFIAPVSSSTTTAGAAFGGGIETKLSRNWSAKTEYLYIDGGSDHTFLSNPFGPPTNVPTVFSHSFQVIKTGLNYRFDGNSDGLPFFSSQMLPSNHSWNGFYVGGNAGIGASLTNIDSVTAGPSPSPGAENVNGNGFAGGAQAGYNYLLWQKYLVGLEGDIGALMINHGVADWDDDNAANLHLVIFQQKTSWYGTLRGRIGTTTGPALLYLTGGAAWVGLQDGILPTSSNVPGSFTSKTAIGWTWGGGTEVALDAHWSAKLESLYVDAGKSDHFALVGNASAVEFKERFVIVRFGLNYAFN
jgi:outer membrane immunogenic protein